MSELRAQLREWREAVEQASSRRGGAGRWRDCSS